LLAFSLLLVAKEVQRLMLDKTRLRKLILEEISRHHKIGEQVGGSGHMGWVSVTKLDIGEPKEIEYNGK